MGLKETYAVTMALQVVVAAVTVTTEETVSVAAC